MTKPLDKIHPQYIVDENGKKRSVILSIKEFEEMIEDLDDLACIAKRKDEKTTSHQEFLKELKKDGLL
jgi:PHD/YefM family antitoxin component YafN of YafNO toxin-antitoxin module